MAELGELLRRTREDKGLSLAQVEEATKIRSAYLQALEDEKYDLLPPRTYVKGFLKNYARHLDLDPQHVLALYQGSEPTHVPMPVSALLDEPLEALSVRRLWPLWVALLLIVVAAAGWWGYTRYYGSALPAVPPTATPTPTPTSEPPSPTLPPPTATPLPTWTATPTSTPMLGVEVGIGIVGQPSWVRVDVDGQEAFAGVLEPGTTRTWTARERILLRCGNAGAVRATFNGLALGFLGELGQVLEREWTAPGVPTRTLQASPTKAP